MGRKDDRGLGWVGRFLLLWSRMVGDGMRKVGGCVYGRELCGGWTYESCTVVTLLSFLLFLLLLLFGGRTGCCCFRFGGTILSLCCVYDGYCEWCGGVRCGLGTEECNISYGRS